VAYCLCAEGIRVRGCSGRINVAGPASQLALFIFHLSNIGDWSTVNVGTMIISSLLLSLYASIAFAFSFSASGCVDEAGTTECFADVLNEVAGTCATICGCNSPFGCTNANKDCLIGCACVGYEKSINCILSSCWNKVCYQIRRCFLRTTVNSDILLSRFILAHISLYWSNHGPDAQSQFQQAGHMSWQRWISLDPAHAPSATYGLHSSALGRMD
jgi:hypothetical protein